MAKYPPLHGETYVNLGPDGEYVNYDTLTPEQKKYVGKRISELAGKAVNDFLASKAAEEAYGIK